MRFKWEAADVVKGVILERIPPRMPIEALGETEGGPPHWETTGGVLQ